MPSDRPIRVLYVTHEPNLTGASRSLIDLLSSLDRDKVEPYVLLRNNGPLEAELKKIDVPYGTVLYALAVSGPQTKIPSFAKELVNRIAVRKIRKIVRDRKIDIVHNNSLLVDVGMRAARADELPYVVHVRDLVSEDHNLVFADEVRVKGLMSAASYNIFISEFVGDKFRSWIGESPYQVIFNAVTVPGSSAREQRPFSRARYKLFLPGRFARGKGQLDAIKAVAEVRRNGYDASLLLAGGVGQDDYYRECVSAAEEASGGVRIESFIEDVGHEYARADATLMCSTAEAMGRVTAEGMLSGCLVIGANAGATAEIINDGENGLLYEAGDPHALAEKITWAIDNPGEAAAIAEAGASYALEMFNKGTYSEQILSIYEKVLVGWAEGPADS